VIIQRQYQVKLLSNAGQQAIVQFKPSSQLCPIQVMSLLLVISSSKAIDGQSQVKLLISSQAIVNRKKSYQHHQVKLLSNASQFIVN
jgi:hypothetical protein